MQSVTAQNEVGLLFPKVALAMRLKSGLGRAAFGALLKTEKNPDGVSREQVRAYEEPGNATSERVLKLYARVCQRPWPDALIEELQALKEGRSAAQADEEPPASPRPEKRTRKRRGSPR